MQKLASSDDLYRGLGCLDEVLGSDGVINPETALAALRQHFDELDYIDPYMSSHRSSSYTPFFYKRNNPLAEEVFRLLPDMDDVVDFVLFVIRDRSDENESQVSRFRRTDFWSRASISFLPAPDASRVHRALCCFFFEVADFQNARVTINTMIRNFPDSETTSETLSNFIEHFNIRAHPRLAECRQQAPSSISRYLNDQYEKSPQKVWPLIRAYWSTLFYDGEDREFDRMQELCKDESDFRMIGDSVLDVLSVAATGHPLGRKIVDNHLGAYSGNVSAESLHKLLKSDNDSIARRAYFWLAELYRDDPRTFDFLMETVREDDNAERRRYVFGLVFFHYHNAVERVAAIVEAAWADPENEEEYKLILTGDSEDRITPAFFGARERDIAFRGTNIRRARIFHGKCRKAKIDCGVKMEPSLKRAMRESIDNILASDLPKKAMMRIAYKSLSPGERKWLNKVPIYQEFNTKHKERLQSISRTDAAAIAGWLDDAWDEALNRFGYKGMACGVIAYAFEHLLDDDHSEAANQIRKYRILEKNLERPIYEIITASLELKRLSHNDAELSSEIKERAFFLLLEGKESEEMAALERAANDALAAAR